jgi:hypothetical protein
VKALASWCWSELSAKSRVIHVGVCGCGGGGNGEDNDDDAEDD